MPWIVEADPSIQTKVPVLREHHLVQEAVFAGGLPGCGKSLLTALLASFERVEIQIYKEELEHVASLCYLGRIDEDAASALIRLMTDMDLYNVMQSRETNFRFSDCSSIFQNPGIWRYLRRLFQPGDAAATRRIQTERPILQILMHNLLVLIPPVLRAMGERASVIEMVRHPLYMIKQWHLYMHRYGNDARDFSICFAYKGMSLPFFALGWEEKYIASNPMDQVIYSIAYLTQKGEEILGVMSQGERSRFLRIPFEPFVLDPWPFIEAVEQLLKTKRTPLTYREMKRQRIPRKRIGQALALPIYWLNGWRPPQKGATEREELLERRKFAARYASAEAMEVLDRISEEYEEKYIQGIV